jgi:hypothetical protein
MFEILFLAFAITVLLRWPEDVRRMRERSAARYRSGRRTKYLSMRPIARQPGESRLLRPN